MESRLVELECACSVKPSQSIQKLPLDINFGHFASLTRALQYFSRSCQNTTENYIFPNTPEVWKVNCPNLAWGVLVVRKRWHAISQREPYGSLNRPSGRRRVSCRSPPYRSQVLTPYGRLFESPTNRILGRRWIFTMVCAGNFHRSA